MLEAHICESIEKLDELLVKCRKFSSEIIKCKERLIEVLHELQTCGKLDLTTHEEYHFSLLEMVKLLEKCKP
jgi:uncharacterized protein Yka (UPF0111/DUF47 family)